MKMRFDISRGLVARLFLCLGFVLLLALVASVGPAGAVVPRPCVDSCDRCVIDEGSEDCTTTDRCSPICRIRVGNRMQTVYFHFTRECCTYTRHQWCQPQVRCTTNNQCIPTGNPGWKDCKGTVKTCEGWVWDGNIYYDSKCSA
jgi:hypothetical protein